jgi:hypothetical protein
VAVRSNDAARLESSTGTLQTIRSVLAVTQETSNTPRVDGTERTTKQRKFPTFLKNIKVTSACRKDRIWTLPRGLSMEDASISVYPAVISARYLSIVRFAAFPPRSTEFRRTGRSRAKKKPLKS